MIDQEVRELERRADSGDRQAALDLAVARVRSGTGNAIDEAHVYWSGGEDREALDVLLVRWREARSTELSELIELVSDHVSKRRGALQGRTRAALAQSWSALESEGDPLDRQRLLEALIRFRCREANGLLLAAQSWPSDPRVSGALVALCQAPPNNWRGGRNLDFWQTALELIEAIGDPRAPAGLESALESGRTELVFVRLGDFFADELPPLISRLRRDSGALTDDEIASLRRFVTTLSAPDTTQAWTQALATPESDEAVEALAQALSEAGDPRGEFFQLQLAKSKSKSGRGSARERELFNAHWRAWLDGLGPFVQRKGDVVFERGFLAGTSLYLESAEELPGQLLEAPAWRTLRRVSFSAYCSLDPLTLLDRLPRVPPELEGVSWRVFERSYPLTWLRFARSTEATLTAASDCQTLQDLRELDLGSCELRDRQLLTQLWSCPLGKQLTHLSLRLPEKDFWSRSREVVPQDAALPLQVLEIGDARDGWPPQWVLTFTRGSAGLSRVRIQERRKLPREPYPALRRLLTGLTHPTALQGLERIDLKLRPDSAKHKMLARLREALAELGADYSINGKRA